MVGQKRKNTKGKKRKKKEEWQEETKNKTNMIGKQSLDNPFFFPSRATFVINVWNTPSIGRTDCLHIKVTVYMQKSPV